MARAHAESSTEIPGKSVLGSLRALWTPGRTTVRVPKAWAAERGDTLLQCGVHVLGGFPESLRSQHTLKNTTMHITDRYLIMDEGGINGFALPLERLLGTAILPQHGVQPPLLTIWYQDSEHVGSFGICFRGTARTFRGQSRAVQAHRLLNDLGVIDIDSGSFTPSVHVPWSHAGSVAEHDVLWSGRAIASCAGPFASRMDSCQVWLTEQYLIWVPTHGTGLNCLALADVMECRNGHGDRLAVGIEDPQGARYDLYFDFGDKANGRQPVSRVIQVLAAAGVPTGTSAAPLAPWRAGGTRRPAD